MPDPSKWNPTTPPPNEPIWHYLDLEYLKPVIENEQLRFKRVDQYSDELEGSIPQRNAVGQPLRTKDGHALYNWRNDELIEHRWDEHARYQFNRKRTYANCWCSYQHESIALWRLFTETNQGVVIKSTPDRFYSAIEWPVSDRTETASVQYINYASENPDQIPSGDPLAPFFHKQNGYAYEHEFRGAIMIEEAPYPEDASNYGIMQENLDRADAVMDEYLPVDVALEDLVEEVRVSPEAEEYVLERTERLVSEIDVGVSKSELGIAPNFFPYPHDSSELS